MCPSSLKCDSEVSEVFDDHVQIVLLGDTCSGKTCLLARYLEGEFQPNPQSTLGIKPATRVIQIDGKRVKASILDTQGLYKNYSTIKSCIEQTVGAMLVYDTSESLSLDGRGVFEAAAEYIKDVRSLSGTSAPIMMVANKVDLGLEAAVPAEAARAFAADNGAMFLEASAASGTNVDLAFEVLISEAYYSQKQRRAAEAEEQRKAAAAATQQNGRASPLKGSAASNRWSFFSSVLQYRPGAKASPAPTPQGSPAKAPPPAEEEPAEEGAAEEERGAEEKAVPEEEAPATEAPVDEVLPAKEAVPSAAALKAAEA